MKECKKNKCVLVYDTQFGESYVEGAINRGGVTDGQLLSIIAQRMRTHVATSKVISWPPHVDELVDYEEIDPLVYQFVSFW